jgi:hypothetical protein
MLGSLATFGYANKHTGQEIEWAMRVNPAALLVDTRYHPVCSWSKLWQWKTLEKQWGTRYHWLGKWLGNVNHGTGQPIQLANEQKGIVWIVQQLERGSTLILLCACPHYPTCHRRVIYEKVKTKLDDRLIEFAPGQKVVTPHGVGVIAPTIPIDVHRARNRYTVYFARTGARFFFPHELQPYEEPHQLLIA